MFGAVIGGNELFTPQERIVGDGSESHARLRFIVAYVVLLLNDVLK